MFHSDQTACRIDKNLKLKSYQVYKKLHISASNLLDMTRTGNPSTCNTIITGVVCNILHFEMIVLHVELEINFYKLIL